MDEVSVNDGIGNRKVQLLSEIFRFKVYISVFKTEKPLMVTFARERIFGS